MAAGLVHPDSHFRNIIYDPVTLQVRIIDIEGFTRKKPQNIWASMDASFSRWFGYNLATSSFWWGLTSIISVLIERPFELELYLLVLHCCFCMMKKKTLEIFAPRVHEISSKGVQKEIILCRSSHPGSHLQIQALTDGLEYGASYGWGLRAASIVVYVHPLSRIVDAENIVEREVDTNQCEAIEQDDDGYLKVISIHIGFAQYCTNMHKYIYIYREREREGITYALASLEI